MLTNHFNGICLRGEYENTTSSVQIKDNGDLVVELRDFADDAEPRVGGEYTYRLLIPRAEKLKLLRLLKDNCHDPYADQQPDRLLLFLMQRLFVDYYDVFAWLNRHDIRFQRDFERWM